MITQMSNGWYIFDEHEVPRILDMLMLAGYQRMPHWFFVHGPHHIIIQYSRRGMSILAPPDVQNAYADLFDIGDGDQIAGQLARLGWRRHPSYGLSGPGAAVYIMSNAITDDELWLEIRGPKPHLVRAALDPLGVEHGAGVKEQTGHTRAHPARATPTLTLPNVTAHALVTTEVYLPDAQTGVIVGARAYAPGVTLCYVRLQNGMIDIYRSTDLERITGASPIVCVCGHPMTYYGFAPRTISKEAASLPADWRPPAYREEPIRVMVLSAVKVWQCRRGQRREQSTEHVGYPFPIMPHMAHPYCCGMSESQRSTYDNVYIFAPLPHRCHWWRPSWSRDGLLSGPPRTRFRDPRRRRTCG